METVDIKLDRNCSIKVPELTNDTTIVLSIEKIQELVKFLEMDEIIDTIKDKNQIKILINRLCSDYTDIITDIFIQFLSKNEKYELTDINKLEEDLGNYLQKL